MPKWTWHVLRAGSMRLDGGGMFGVVPKTIWSRLVEPDDANRIPLQTNCLLLCQDDHLVLIETGFGNKWSEKERGFYDLEHRTIIDALTEIGVDAMAITDVILTHLHFDHAGGLTSGDPGGDACSNFPQATIHVQRTEWEDALANKAVMTRTYLRSHLDPIAGQVRTIDGVAEVLPGLRVMPMPGHTWGQHAVCFDDADGIVCFPGDVIPTTNHFGLAFSLGYDIEPYTNMQSKLGLLTRAAAEEWRLVLDHEPGDPVCRVRDAGGGRFEAVRGS